LKRKTVVRNKFDTKDTGMIRVYVKGAPEYIFALCDKTLDHKGGICEFDNKDAILSEKVEKQMAGEMKLKVLSYAFKDIPLQSLNQLMHTHNNESPQFREEIESDLVYLTTIGLEDPVIEGVRKTVQLIRFGKELEDDDV